MLESRFNSIGIHSLFYTQLKLFYCWIIHLLNSLTEQICSCIDRGLYTGSRSRATLSTFSGVSFSKFPRKNTSIRQNQEKYLNRGTNSKRGFKGWSHYPTVFVSVVSPPKFSSFQRNCVCKYRYVVKSVWKWSFLIGKILNTCSDLFDFIHL